PTRRSSDLTGYRRRRQCGIAQLKPDATDRNAERIGGHLAHDGVGAGAEVLRSGLDYHRAIRVHADARTRRAPIGGIGAGRHAPADQHFAVTHGAWFHGTARPAERLRALLITGAQRLAGERLVLVRIVVGVVAQPKL